MMLMMMRLFGTVVRIGELAQAGGVGIGPVRFIRRAQELKFSPAEIEQFLALPGVTDLDQFAITTLVAGELDEIDARIRDLTRLRAALAADGATRDRCPVLAALADA